MTQMIHKCSEKIDPIYLGRGLAIITPNEKQREMSLNLILAQIHKYPLNRTLYNYLPFNGKYGKIYCRMTEEKI